MLVATRRVGVVERIDVPENRIFEFYPGLGGFEDHHRFALIIEPDSPVEWLQSMSNQDVCFPLVAPESIVTDYTFELPDPDATALGASSADDLIVRIVLTVREPVEETTANLLAPLVLNTATRLGRQLVLQDSDYPIRAAVFVSLEATIANRTTKAA
jgi:flagellar assembly factor FliW